MVASIAFSSELRDRERDRVSAHFEWVLVLLRSQDTHGWSDARRHARERTLRLLEGYARRGVFPRNTTDRDRRRPAFIDAYGNACAVAHLLIVTGHGELASRIHRTMNLAYVPELAGSEEIGNELTSWSELAGLTADEVALIQPDHECDSEHNECRVGQTTCPGSGGIPCCDDSPVPDGQPCTDRDGDPSFCEAGECPNASGGCSVRAGDLPGDAIAPVLAALFLMALVARRRA